MKKKGVMVVLFVFGLAVLTSGCETAKGLMKDSRNFWQAMRRADKWFQKNYW